MGNLSVTLEGLPKIHLYNSPQKAIAQKFFKDTPYFFLSMNPTEALSRVSPEHILKSPSKIIQRSQSEFSPLENLSRIIPKKIYRFSSLDLEIYS